MVYTVTFNPSLDYIASVNNLTPGKVNRASGAYILEGGKGINVSVVLNNLGIENIALGFIAGFTGRRIVDGIRSRGCRTDFIELSEGLSRINIKLKSDTETEINADGPAIGGEALNALFDKLRALKDGDIVVLAGSVPSKLPENIYARMMEQLSEKKIKIVVDATKSTLIHTLKYHPFLIKPNIHELEEISGQTLKTAEAIIRQAKKLQAMGAEHVLVSMAGSGAILVCGSKAVYQCKAPKGTLINSVGAGDSMVAGFLAGYIRSNSFKTAFKMGIAAGSASAFSPQLATGAEIENIFRILPEPEKIL